ncbi:hypothetical protein [Kribbella pratensis]|uniref:MYXO-CTERM domain-containing protein n=1 Tax=Kribbella pratensis TaxID=2512112 RepID=A0A4R8CII6_9ACTN|nr:hypothetical protein [Kribbella pratensis]TDW76162.1 hypothetical protein EV653_1307 [Kribbella pratensis]
MNHRYGAIALPILVCGMTVVGASAASARPIDPDARHHRPAPAVVVEGPERRVEVPVDDPINEAAQTIAGALLGAGMAAGGLVYYRRRHPLIVG